MKKFKLSNKLMMGAAIACALSVSMSSCSDDDDDKPASTTNTVVTDNSGAPLKFIGVDITANTTWSNDTIYILTSRVKVRPGATLTIEAGTVIKGAQGQETNAKVLMVMRGAKIMAEGTATSPIIFTTVADNIQPGQIQSPNMSSDAQGLWGGLAILGNAKISVSTGTEAQIEGVPLSDTDGLYGGNDDADNSGVLRYVSVRHGGTSIGSGNELNGISFGGVGSGTVVDHIEIVANADDGLEFYGGTVNATNVLVWNNGDDALDTDMSYSGTIDNFILIGPQGSPFELDGPEGSYLGAVHTIKNGTVVATRPDNTAASDLINYDVNTNAALQNIHFTNVSSGQLVNSQNRTSRDYLTMSNITINVTDVTPYISTAEAAISSSVSAGTTGFANVSEFSNWTWAAASGSLSGL